jgi:NTE family protein
VVSERPPFERIALILHGGGALGAYQAGVYQALAEANLRPDWVAGISIGAINSALIAGNPPEGVSAAPFGLPYIAALEGRDEFTHSMINQVPSWVPWSVVRPGFFNLACRRPSSILTARPKP